MTQLENNSLKNERYDIFSFLSFNRFTWILSVLMVADIVTTKINLASGLVHEANGFMANVVQNDFAFIGIKAVGTLLILIILKNVLNRDKKWASFGMWIITTMYTFILINNLYWLMRYT